MLKEKAKRSRKSIERSQEQFEEEREETIQRNEEKLQVSVICIERYDLKSHCGISLLVEMYFVNRICLLL